MEESNRNIFNQYNQTSEARDAATDDADLDENVEDLLLEAFQGETVYDDSEFLAGTSLLMREVIEGIRIA